MQLGLSCAWKNGCPLLDEYLLDSCAVPGMVEHFAWIISSFNPDTTLRG